MEKSPGKNQIFGKYMDLVESKKTSKEAEEKWLKINEVFARDLSGLELSILDFVLMGKSTRANAKFHSMSRPAVEKIIEKLAKVTKELMDKFKV